MLATSPNQVGQYGCIPLLVHYFFCLFNKHVITLQDSSNSLVHSMHGWAIPQDNRIVHQMQL